MKYYIINYYIKNSLRNFSYRCAIQAKDITQAAISAPHLVPPWAEITGITETDINHLDGIIIVAEQNQRKIAFYLEEL